MSGRFTIVGLGPGDPELITLKAARVLGGVGQIAYFAKRGQPGHARSIAAACLRADCLELRLDYPCTTEVALDDPRYRIEMEAFYDQSAGRLAQALGEGDLALLCEGDPFFYGSAMYLYDRLAPRHPTEIVPGVTGMSGCWTRAGTPITHGDDVLTVLPGTLDEAALVERLVLADAAVIMKVGRNLPKIRSALAVTGLAGRAIYVERGTMATERVMPLDALDAPHAPYFSIVLVPGRQRVR